MSRFTHAAGRCLQVDDASLYFEEAGNPAGPPVLLLHGGLGSMADFNPVLDGLHGHFRLIGIDFRGHGRSTLGSKPLTYQQHQADVAAVLKHLGIARCAVVGFSDGGVVAYRMAADTPDTVSSLVTVGAQWKLDASGPVFDMLSGLTADMWSGMFPDSVADYRARNPAPDFDALVRAVVGLWTDLTASGYPGAGVARIVAPSLVIRGDADHLFSLTEAAELVARLDGANFFNVPFSGHEVHRDAPEFFLKAVTGFLLAPGKLGHDA